MCDSPIGVFVNAVTGSTAELMWDNSSNPDSVVIKYRIPALTPYKFIKLSGNPNPGDAWIENLSLNTTYKVEVKYVCSGISSDYTTPLYFTTANSNGRMLNEEQSSSGILSPINIYPNPANSIVHYDINSNAESNVQVRISDALGHRMFSHEHTCTQGINSFEVFIEGWPSGIYVFEMINAGVVYKYKLNVY
ncbi:MAG: T9SS type A sorting domain-containing protein [Bacteroidetes bacterium]|nr:T9SS type A sorting domain-containing protein [Bacteroidota bacterium]